MGMDMITLGWTAEKSKYDAKAIDPILTALTDEWLAENAHLLDYSGYYEESPELRAALVEGAADYKEHMDDAHRYGVAYEIMPESSDTTRWFHVAGGGSYGDDPYEGWAALAVFLEACGLVPQLAAAAGFIGGGIRP